MAMSDGSGTAEAMATAALMMLIKEGLGAFKGGGGQRGVASQKQY